MQELKIVTNEAGVPTMSSIDMVAYINASREAGKAEISHNDFMKKVPKVLGEGVGKFSHTYTHPQNGQVYPKYDFPEREATLMAMSYSYELQAKVYDAWAAAKEALKKPVFELMDTSTHAKAKLAYLQTEVKLTEASLLLEDKSKELAAALPAVSFRDAVVADDTMYSFAEAAKILGIGPRKFMRALREGGYLRKDNTPYERFIEYLKPSFRPQYALPNGDLAPATTYVTSKGLVYLQKKLSKSNT